jgi:hypothetical protein
MFRHVKLEPVRHASDSAHITCKHNMARAGSRCVNPLRGFYDEETAQSGILIEGAPLVRADWLWTYQS